MSSMNYFEKLKILAEGAKYDASCATSGVERRNAGRLGNASGSGICHSWSADGRCISLLKVLMSNRCVFDCEYCINRRTSDVERASFEPEELAKLTMEFYRRNYIEGLFLSSAVEVSPDHTSEKMLKCLVLLREVFGFSGYIHAKIIPGTSQEIIHKIGMNADRISVNIELPSKESLKQLAPQKKPEGIFDPMKQINETLLDRKQIGTSYSNKRELTPDMRKNDQRALALKHNKYKERFAPAGQTTQMIIGASPETDRQIVLLSGSLYKNFRMKRVYYSAYIPINESPLLPARMTAPPLLREHRLYQADWLMRYYGFGADEILDEADPYLDLDMDPKMAWALRHMEMFPVEINLASPEELLRIPGVGTLSVRRILRQRRYAAIKYDDLNKMGVVLKRAKYFITCCGRYYGDIDSEPENVRKAILDGNKTGKSASALSDETQISMFFTTDQKQIGTTGLLNGRV